MRLSMVVGTSARCFSVRFLARWRPRKIRSSILVGQEPVSGSPLLNIARRTGAEMVASVEIDVPFGRLDIADYLGLTVETVSREISKLKRDGLISTTGPHKIILRHLSGLRDIAGIDLDEPSGDTITHSQEWRYSAKTGEHRHA
jgi:Crp-like helix-turn-helix domain